MKEKLLNEISKYDKVLYNFLLKNYDNFTLASYVDYLAKLDNTKKALCHIDKKGIRREFTYEDLSKLSNKMANYLRNKGVKKGDVVALVLRNNYEFYIASLALQKLGAITLTLQYMTKEAQYRNIFERCNPKCIIADDYEIVINRTKSTFVLNELDKSSNDDVLRICTYPSSTFSRTWYDLSEFQKESDEFISEQVGIYDLGYLFATSGTTGEPKLVMHNYGFSLSHFFTGLWYGVEEGKKHYTIADSGWGMGTWNMCAVMLHRGLIYMNDFNRFNPGYLLDCMISEKVNTLCVPRSILVPLLNYLEENPNVEPPKLKIISSAGELVDDFTKSRCFKVFGVAPKEGYGMTEVTLPIYERNDGRRVISPLYSDVTIEQVKGLANGEIVVTGGKIGLLMGYLHKLRNTKAHYVLYRTLPESHKGLVWRTGDSGYRDREGNLFCDGRLGNTVKVNDALVNKTVVEQVIKMHPAVYDCMVESKPDEQSGNVLYAYVELKENTTFSEQEIKDFVKEKLQDYCRPKYVIFTKLERTNNGKVIRKGKITPPDKGMVYTYKYLRTCQ